MKRRKEFYLDESTISYLEQYKDERHCRSLAAALAGVVDEHSHRNDISPTKILINELSTQITDKMKDTLTRIRLGTNNADRNSEVILLLLNTLLSYSPYNSLIEKDTPQLTQARKAVKDRIAHYRQKKLDAAVRKNLRIKMEPEKSGSILSEDELI
jgi:hypothetical protein